MTVELSKSILDRRRSVRFVLAALDSKSPLLVQRLTQKARSATGSAAREGIDTPPDFAGLFGFLRHHLQDAIDKVMAAEKNLDVLRRQAHAARRTRDRWRETVYQKILRLRRLVRAEFKAPDLDFLALFYPAARSFLGMLQHAETVVEVFGMDGVEEALGEASLERSFQVEPRREELRSVAARLRSSIDQVDELVQRIDKALLARNEAVDAYDALFLRTARIFEEYFLYAGDTEMAKRVRPSRRRPGRIDEILETQRESDPAEEASPSALMGAAVPDAAPDRQGQQETSVAQGHTSRPERLSEPVTPRPPGMSRSSQGRAGPGGARTGRTTEEDQGRRIRRSGPFC